MSRQAAAILRARDGMTGSERLDLGLALLSMCCVYRQPLTLEDIGAWCNCSRQNIEHIQNRAMRKLREKLSPEELKELREALEPDRRMTRPFSGAGHHHPHVAR